MRKKLTDRSIRSRAPDKGTLELWDTVTPGLALRIHAGGKRSYCVTTRLAPSGKQIRRTIGTTDILKLSEARAEARKVITDAAKGIDSASREARQEAARRAQVELERAKANSFRSVVEGYLSDEREHGAAGLKSNKTIRERIELHAMPRFGDRPIRDITRSDVNDLMRDMVKGRKPVAANRVLAHLKRVFGWAVEEGKIETSTVTDLRKPFREKSRDRVLTDAEIAQIWLACDSLTTPYAGAVRTMLLTGARRNEAGGLRRSEIRGDEWHLPAERCKNGRAHIVPLSPLARDVIAGVGRVNDGDAVFTFDGETAVSGWSKIKRQLDAEIGKAHAMPRWTFHDLRRTLVTGMVETLGIAPHVTEAVVNHVSGAARSGVAGIYNRSVLLPQRREALEAWASHVKALVDGVDPAENVTRLRA